MLVDIHKSDAMGNVFTLCEPLTYPDQGGSTDEAGRQPRHFEADVRLTVPVGFSSDGASVPRFFWRVVFPPGDQKALRRRSGGSSGRWLDRHAPRRRLGRPL